MIVLIVFALLMALAGTLVADEGGGEYMPPPSHQSNPYLY